MSIENAVTKSSFACLNFLNGDFNTIHVYSVYLPYVP